MKADDLKGISLVSLYSALFFCLFGFAARMKSDFHSRMELSKLGFTVAAILVAFAVIAFLFSLRKRQG
jgi:hypothetical protein